MEALQLLRTAELNTVGEKAPTGRVDCDRKLHDNDISRRLYESRIIKKARGVARIALQSIQTVDAQPKKGQNFMQCTEFHAMYCILFETL